MSILKQSFQGHLIDTTHIKVNELKNGSTRVSG